MTTSAAPSPSLAKFQTLLRDLFQFDAADLDFGIYRIMNHKRDAVEAFVSRKLPETVSMELGQGSLDDQSRRTARLEEARAALMKELPGDALDADGNLAEQYRGMTAFRSIRNYLDAQRAARYSMSAAAIETAIYNHLHAFFNRYYLDGDFISKRRYSRNNRYAIPYNGEEVYLHWANSDQYYVKTGEHFQNYDWNAPNGVAVRFRIRSADIEQNNIKGDRRVFLPVVSDAEWDADARALTVPFQFRPLNAGERITYGARNQQDKIIAAAVQSIPKRIADAHDAPDAIIALNGERGRNAKDEPVTHLEYHLRQYTRKNDSDFFIHKDLRDFLSRELDFYLKNEVLNLDDLTAAGEFMSDGWFQIMRLIKRVGSDIIEFLAQIENFQKKLWEKRKFVTNANYCVALRVIPSEFYPEIRANAAQWDEWLDLFNIDGADRSDAFLNANPTLVLDTRHFKADFTDRLLESFDDLDGMTDGLLIHGENWQALRLLSERYKGSVDCIYIDPPYNTDATEIIYKNGYRHSSWLTLMENRINVAATLLTANSAWVTAIDDTEMTNLAHLFDSRFRAYDRNVVVVNHHPAGSGLEGTNVSSTHEYAIFMTPSGAKVLRGEKVKEDVSEIGFVRTGTATSNLRVGRPNSFYAILVDPSTSEVMGAESPPLGQEGYPRGETSEGFIRIYPVGRDGTERVWRRSYLTIQSCIDNGEIICKNNRSLYLVTDRTGKRRPVFSNWTDTKYNAGSYGSNLLRDLFRSSNLFSYPKSIYTVRDCVEACIHDMCDATVLDYFAGSGTTAHAVINLNREDGGERKFILVEMGEYFDTVLLPRVKKVTFAPEWRNGSPVRPANSEEAERAPRIVKYISIESYEDALDGIQLDDAARAMKLEDRIEGYLLNYMLEFETKGSATLLNTSDFVSPFDYKLRAHVNGNDRIRNADIAETFNYLIGLNVRSRRVYYDGDRRYLAYRGEVRESPGREVAVIWRDVNGLTVDDHERDRDFIASQNMAGDAETIYVNSPTCIPNATPVEPIFHDRMFAPAFN